MVQKHFLHCLICCFIFFVCLFITACGNSDKSSNQDSLSGSAIKGVISDGIVSAYRIINADKVLLAESRTNPLGQFKLDIPPEHTNQLILLELSTDQKTRMRCDLTKGCTDYNSGALIEFGNSITLPSFFKLYGIAGNDESTRHRAFISPLTHLVVSTARNLNNSLSNDAINTASSWVTNALKLGAPPTQVQLKDITKLENLPQMSDEELKQSIISAAMYSVTMESNWANENQSIDSVNLQGILSEASALTTDLSTMLTDAVDNSLQTNALNRIQSDLDSQFDDLHASDIVILTQPASIDISENQSLNLFVQANSDINLRYQWFKNSEMIVAANSAIYSKPAGQLDDTGLYTVLISNDFSDVMSLSASVNVSQTNTKLEITRQPQSKSITEGDPLQLRVESNHGADAHYQWQKNGSIIPGATNNTYYIDKSTLSDEGSYRVTISNNYSQISSNFVNVWVSESVEAVSIIKQPQSKVASEGTTIIFSVRATGDGFLRYQWRKNGIPIENAYLDALRIKSVSVFDQANYDVVVTNSQGSVHSQTAELSILPNDIPVDITHQPQSTTVELGQSFTLNVGASGGNSLNYQWYFNGNAIQNATSHTLHISNTGLHNEGAYTVLVNNNNSSKQSDISFVSVISPALASPAIASLELTWDTPTEREDGSALSYDEIMAYVIEYGQNESSLEHSITVDNQPQNSLILDGLDPGELMLRIATIDSDGNQGEFSEMIWVAL